MDADHDLVTVPSVRAGPTWLSPWLCWLDLALHREILRLRARYELSMDELRGLYVSDEQVDRLVARTAPEPDIWSRMAVLDGRRHVLLEATSAASSPLRYLAEEFALDGSAVLAVVVCLAPEVDLSYQTLFAYLNDDVARRLPTVDLCERLGDGAPLQPRSPVLADGVLEAHPVVGAPLWRSTGLCLSEPARRHLLTAGPGRPPAKAAVRRPGLVLLQGRAAEDARRAAEGLARHDGRPLVTLDDSVDEPDRRLRYGLLEARIAGGPLLVSSRDLVLGADPDSAVLGLDLVVRSPAQVLVAVRPDDLSALSVEHLEHQRLVVDEPDSQLRHQLWLSELARYGVTATHDDVVTVAGMFALGPAQIASAAAAVAGAAEPDLAVLVRAARERVAAGFHGLTERVESTYTWDDLVLPSGTVQRLRELAAAIRLRHQVFDTWAMGRLVGGHASVRALFAGASGTGKTMSAAVLAGDLGLELHRVDLSAMVSKYIGETEKNLAQVFRAAEQSSALLFFDEADALFGKRTEVKDAHDRYANIETSFMLQRMESYDGVVILASNLAGNLDDAFSRRIHFHVDFPMPDEALRVQLWRKAFPPSAPVHDDVDPTFLAGMFPMSGGDVRSASLMAAFLAAREGAPIAMRHVVTALARQRRQQGKVPSVAEFKGYLRLVRDEEG